MCQYQLQLWLSLKSGSENVLEGNSVVSREEDDFRSGGLVWKSPAGASSTGVPPISHVQGPGGWSIVEILLRFYLLYFLKEGRAILHLLDHSPDAHNIWCWVRLKPEACSSARNSCCSPIHISTELGQKWNCLTHCTIDPSPTPTASNANEEFPCFAREQLFPFSLR